MFVQLGYKCSCLDNCPCQCCNALKCDVQGRARKPELTLPISLDTVSENLLTKLDTKPTWERIIHQDNMMTNSLEWFLLLGI